MDLKEIPSDRLRYELQRRGFQTNNLWKIEDVTNNHKCTDDEAMEILVNALNSESTIEHIFSVIHQITEI